MDHDEHRRSPRKISIHPASLTTTYFQAGSSTNSSLTHPASSSAHQPQSSTSLAALPKLWNTFKASSSSFSRKLLPIPSPEPPSASTTRFTTPALREPPTQSLLLDPTDLLGPSRDRSPIDNPGPKVHVSPDEERSAKEDGPSGADSSDDSDAGPPPWLTPHRPLAPAPSLNPLVGAPGKARSTTVVSPVPTHDSQTLLRAQLSSAALPRHHSPSPAPTPAQHSPTPSGHALEDTRALHVRKYYILTSAGKPVWSTEEDNDEREHGDVTGQMGLMQAVISIFEDDGDQLRYIDAGGVKIAVLLKPPLYLFAVSNWGEPESTLRMHLEYLFLLVQSILSLTQLERMFERRPNYDLRRTLSGTECLFQGLVDRLQWDLSMMMGSLSVLSCPAKLRDAVGHVVTPPDGPGEHAEIGAKLLYAIVLAHGKVVSLVRPKKHSVHPSDLHLILSTVLSSASLRTSESWLPICLPGYNATGFLHAYVRFIDPPVCALGLIFVSGDRHGFSGLQQWATDVARAEVWKELATLGRASGSGEYMLEQLGVPGLRHFVFKDKRHVQISFPEWDDDYLDLRNRQRLIVMYQKAHDLLHPQLAGSKRPPSKFIYLKNRTESILAWVSDVHELYLTVSPLLSKSATVMSAHNVVKWIKGREEELFLMSGHSF